jgi:hypothetical protein
MNFQSFDNWLGNKNAPVKEEDGAPAPPAQVPDEKTPNNSEILAKISEIENVRKDHLRNKKDLEAQLCTVRIDILKNDMNKNSLVAKQKELEEALEIAKTSRKEAMSHEK